MLLIANSDDEYDSAMAALKVINSLRGGPPTKTYATRPNVEDTPWIKTAYPHEHYL